MTEEPEIQETPEPEAAPKSRGKIILLAGLLAGVFLLAAVGNYFHLKATYVPPEPAAGPTHDEVEAPLMVIDLGILGSEVSGDSLTAEAASLPDSVAPVAAMSPEDSLKLVLQQLETENRAKDSLLAAAAEPPASQTKADPAGTDSTGLKRSAKLAKIVENMEPEDAARMLEPLSDDIVIHILLRLKQRQAAEVMAALPPSRAAGLSRAIMEPVVQRQ
ncbi:MAG: hypothetical protein C4524_01660 [Candidatus Zixiibacteriota bacterium]|nr:MAG: hypothetical protein C4524_01660 [candidate division Zixibacteria bacterium]